MSRASAKFYFDDGEILNVIYNGTSDFMCEFMSSKQREPWDWYYGNGDWKDRNRNVPECRHEGEHVLVYSDYGSGTYWHGTACRECMVFKGPMEYGYGECSDEYVPFFYSEQKAREATPMLMSGDEVKG